MNISETVLKDKIYLLTKRAKVLEDKLARAEKFASTISDLSTRLRQLEEKDKWDDETLNNLIKLVQKNN